MRVGLAIPCFIDAFFPEVGIATLELLERLGVEVVYPQGQTCCGQPMANNGIQGAARGAEAHFVDLFADFRYCGDALGQLRPPLALASGRHSADRPACAICARIPTNSWNYLHDVLEVRDFPWAEFPHKVGLHNSCGTLRSLRHASMSELGEPAFSKPLDLLSKVPGIEFVTPARPDECCGFGGTFSVAEGRRLRPHGAGQGARSCRGGRGIHRLRRYLLPHASARLRGARRRSAAVHSYRADPQRSPRMRNESFFGSFFQKRTKRKRFFLKKRSKNSHSCRSCRRRRCFRGRCAASRLSRQAAVGAAAEARRPDARHPRMAGVARPRLGHQEPYAEPPCPNIWSSSRAQAQANGVQVHWARDADEHNATVLRILRQHNAKTLAKSKSMLTRGMRDGAPSWSATASPSPRPIWASVSSSWTGRRRAISWYRRCISCVRMWRGSSRGPSAATPNNADPHALAEHARMTTRPLMLDADAGMTGANFLVAETGAVVVCTNEGNADLSANLPKVHIVSAGGRKAHPAPGRSRRLHPAAVAQRAGARRSRNTPRISAARGMARKCISSWSTTDARSGSASPISGLR